MPDPTTVIIIGAARSGTKLLRDLLGQPLGVSVVPYDVNYLWRYGNEASEHDELAPESLTAETTQRIRSSIQAYAGAHPILIEKTVGNSLRVPFVSAVFPDAHFVFLVRDGYDVAESSLRQWSERPPLNYLFRKALSFPWRSAPGYAATYLRKNLSRGDNGSLKSWGPIYSELRNDTERYSPIEVCARQWAACVEASISGFETAGIKPTTLRYEDLISDPEGALGELVHAIPNHPGMDTLDLSLITSDNIAKGRSRLDQTTQALISATIDPTLQRLNNWMAS